MKQFFYFTSILALIFASRSLFAQEIVFGMGLFEKEMTQVLIEQDHKAGDSIRLKAHVYHKHKGDRGFHERASYVFFNDSIARIDFWGDRYFALMKGQSAYTVYKYDTAQHKIITDGETEKDSAGYQVYNKKILAKDDSVNDYDRVKRDASGRVVEHFFYDYNHKPCLCLYMYGGDSIYIVRKFIYSSNGSLEFSWEDEWRMKMSDDKKTEYDTIINRSVSSSGKIETNISTFKKCYCYDEFNRLTKVILYDYDPDYSGWYLKHTLKFKYLIAKKS